MSQSSAKASNTPLKSTVTVESVDDDEDIEFEDAAQTDTAALATVNPNGSSTQSAPDKEYRGGLSPGTESQFEVWLRRYVNEPLLQYVVPEWMDPNHISYLNAFVCCLAFLCSYLCYRYEHVYPQDILYLRFFVAFLIFVGISLDCLDGMQARKMNRCSKLGEVLDHSLDAANVPLIACCVLMTIWPDSWTSMISIVGGGMVYNAQLVIYRHHHVMVLPPVTGPMAQFLASLVICTFAIFYRLVDRHAYLPKVICLVFAGLANLAQFNNTWFYIKHLLYSFPDRPPVIWPHIRFTITMSLHCLLLAFGYITACEYLISAVVLSYRLNGRYVLDTLLSRFRATIAAGGRKNSLPDREQLLKDDTNWRWECVISIIVLLVIAKVTNMPTVDASSSALHFTDSLFHMLFYALQVAAIAANVVDIRNALPILNSKY